MPKPYVVTPRLQAQRKVYIANFYISTGKRVTRSLGTGDRDKANHLATGLVILRNAGVASMSEALLLNIDPDCLPLYFATAAASKDDLLQIPTDVLRLLAKIGADEDFAKASDVSIDAPAPLRAERLDAKRLLNSIRSKMGELQQAVNTERTAREAMERSVLVRAAKAAENAPAFDLAQIEFAAHIKTKTSRRNAAQLVSAINKFRASLPPHVTNVADVLPDHVGTFLDACSAAGDPSRKVSRRRAWHIMIGRFWSFIRERYALPSPMLSISFPEKSAVLRERGDIHWHTLPEIKAAMKALPSDYWRALVGCLAYAGLQLAELCWLRVVDLEFGKGKKRAQLWVTTVFDPDDPLQGHAIKEENRRRHVDVHPRLLLPLLKRHVAAKRHGRVYLFPMPVIRKRRHLPREDQRWRENTLSTHLRGHPGGKQRKPTPALLPPGMNAKSLRRTFGSLLLRSGKTTAQVAAAMGNTETVVAEHYARLKGCEVDIDF